MAAVTHAAFRTLVESFGPSCDEYYSEMISAGAFISGAPYEKWYAIDKPVSEKMVWQVLGGDAHKMAAAAERLAGKGGIGIDINMGCCAPDVLCAGAGAAWLDRSKEDMRAMVRTVYDAVMGADKNQRLSVKMRIAGKTEKTSWLEDTVKMLRDEGVKRIAIHARGERDKYRNAVRYEEVEKAAMAAGSDVSIAVNGDITGPDSMRRAMTACPSASCVMIGREAIRKPWVFEVLKAQMKGDKARLERVIDREEVALNFIELLKQYQPPDFWHTRSKRFFSYYAQGLSFAHYFATKMANCRDTQEASLCVKDYFMRQPSDKVLTI